jgi:hypothetical protein
MNNIYVILCENHGVLLDYIYEADCAGDAMIYFVQDHRDELRFGCICKEIVVPIQMKDQKIKTWHDKR